MNAKEILDLALYAGRIMLESGAEVYRVEDTIARICKSCGADSIESKVTVTGIDATITYNSETVTLIKRIKKKDINLTKIEKINQMSRDLASGYVNANQAKDILNNIGGMQEYKPALLILFSGVSSAFFCLMFKGQVISCLMAFIVGAITRMTLSLLKKINLSGFIIDFTGGMLVSGLSVALVRLLAKGDHNEVIIGSVMILVPGVAITNAILDIFHQDYISGTVKTVDAFITIIAVATGVAIIFSLISLISGGII